MRIAVFGNLAFFYLVPVRDFEGLCTTDLFLDTLGIECGTNLIFIHIKHSSMYDYVMFAVIAYPVAGAPVEGGGYAP